MPRVTSIKAIMLEADAGVPVETCLYEAIQTAIRFDCSVTISHERKRYSVHPADLLGSVKVTQQPTQEGAHGP